MNSVTAEVASSSLVVPAIFSNHLQALNEINQGILGDDKRQTLVPQGELAAKRRSLKQICLRQQARRQKGVDQFVVG